MMKEHSTIDAPRAGSAYRYVVAAFLALVYAFNFMDRQIMAILQEPIRAEFVLSDTQLGLLTGFAFALFYSSCAIPVAWLADRRRRVPLMATAVAIWSFFTAACGLAQNFSQLALARLLVGAGEAGGAPPSYSLLSDYFRPGERGTGLAVYSLGVPIGSAAGAAVGAAVAAHYGWRMAFIAVGAPGLLLALALPIVVREPARGRLDSRRSSAPLSIMQAARAYFADRVLRLTTCSTAMSAFVGYALLAWNPSFLKRVKGMSLHEVSLYYALVLGITGLVGTFAAGWLVDRFGARDRRWYAWLPALAFLLMIPGIGGAILLPGWRGALSCLALPTLLLNIYLAPALAVVQDQSPPERRAMSGAIMAFIAVLVGSGGGPLFVGTMSDLAKPTYGDGSLLFGYAALIPMIVMTIGLHMLAARSLNATK
jgi:MFS family permease